MTEAEITSLADEDPELAPVRSGQQDARPRGRQPRPATPPSFGQIPLTPPVSMGWN